MPPVYTLFGEADTNASKAVSPTDVKHLDVAVGVIIPVVDGISGTYVYIKDSARYARRTLEPFGWSESRVRVCLDACEQHHAFRPRWSMGNEVELVRRSDLVEVLPELVRFGIRRSWLKRQLWHAVPRAGFWPATLEVTRAHWRRMLPGMFRPPGPPQSVT